MGAEVIAALIMLIGQVAVTLISSDLSEKSADAAATRAENFSREATADERAYNLPSNQVDRLMQAGATEGGALQSILGATPYVSPPMQSVAPVSNASNIASLFSTLSSSFGSFGESVRDYEAARTEREMRPVNVQKGYAEIKKIAAESDWTAEQIKVAEATLKMAEGRYVLEIKQMQQDFERGMTEIDNLIKQGELLSQQKDVNQSVIDFNNSAARLNDAKTFNEQFLAKVNKLAADYAEKYGVNVDSNPFTFIAELLMSDKASDLANDIPENIGKWLDIIKSKINNEVSTPVRSSFESLMFNRTNGSFFYPYGLNSSINRLPSRRHGYNVITGEYQ